MKISKQEFDRLVRDRQFSDGPYIKNFGKNYGEPYHPHHRLHGTLKNSQLVESCTDPDWKPDEQN
jgi:hypothetical protein